MPGADLQTLLAPRSERMTASEIRELLKILARPGVISFAGGIPDPSLFDVGAFSAAYAAILAEAEASRQALQYSVSEGYLPLREWIAGRMASTGLACSTDNLVITGGSQQALDFIGKLFIAPGDTVLVTAPTYLGALQAFNAYEPRYDKLGGNATAESIRNDARAAGSRPKLIYVVPDFANPTGETMSRAARERLLDLADELDCLIVEDAAYAALRYDGEPVPPVAALDLARTGDIERTRTLYCGSFSKTLAPALRIGWACGPREIVHRLTLAKQAADLHSPTINQMVMHRVAEAIFPDQVAKVKAVYRRRRDAMLAALERHAPPGVRWTRPDGGMFVWITLPEGLDGRRLLERCIEEKNVAFVPGQAFFADGSGTNTIRLSFSLPSEAVIADGIARLCDMIRAMR